MATKIQNHLLLEKGLSSFEGSHYKVDPASGCWNWLGSCNKWGYAKTTIHHRTVSGHRAFYEAMHGKITEGFQLDHTCRNKKCVNPSHLEPVTAAENTRRKSTTKMNMIQIEDIRKRYSLGGISQSDLAIEYGLCQPHVSTIINFKRWEV